MGRGRTTTGMIIAALLHLRKVDAFPIGKKPDLRGENEEGIFSVKRSLNASKHLLATTLVRMQPAAASLRGSPDRSASNSPAGQASQAGHHLFHTKIFCF